MLGKSLTIKKTKLKDAGNWTCHGSGSNNIPYESASELLVGGKVHTNYDFFILVL